jgi:hypothetical protein
MEQGEIDRICPMLPVLEKHVCSICLGACRRVLRELPCRHAFCPHCIDPWLRQQPTCPDCRQRVGRPIMRKPVRPVVWRPVQPLPPLGRRHVFPLLVLATLTVGGLVAMVMLLFACCHCASWWCGSAILPHDAVTGRFYVGAVHMSCQPTTPQSTWTCSPLPVLCNAAAAGAASRCTVLDAADCQALMSVNSDGTAPCTWCGPVPSAPPAFVTNPPQPCSPQPHGWYAMGDCPSTIANVECGWRSTKPPATPPASLPLPSAGTTNIHGSYRFQCRYGDTFVDYGAHPWPATARQGVGRNATQPPQGESCAALLMGHGSSTTMHITFPAECNNGDLQSNDEVITQKFGACQDKTTETHCVDNGCTWFKKDNIHVCLPVDLINGRATCSFPDMCSKYANAMYEMHAISLQGYTTASSPPTPTGHAAVSKDTCRCTDGYQTAKPVDGTLLICTPCPTKTYGLEGQCHPCLPGTANDTPGTAVINTAFSQPITCPQCKAGTYADQPGMKTCKPCPANQYQPEPKQSTCKPVQAGYVAVTAAPSADNAVPLAVSTGATGEAVCPDGMYALPGTPNKCVTCPVGHVCTGGTSAPCPAGSAQDKTGQSTCSTCDPGEYSAAGSASCQACGGAQYYCTDGEQHTVSTGWYSYGGTSTTRTGQKACPAGFKCENGVMTSCDAGTYSVAGAASCADCAAGTFSTAGKSSCTDCAVGTVSSAGKSTCRACTGIALDAGLRYQDKKGQSACKSCPTDSCTYKSTNSSCQCHCPSTFPHVYSGNGVDGSFCCKTLPGTGEAGPLRQSCDGGATDCPIPPCESYAGELNVADLFSMLGGSGW